MTEEICKCGLSEHNCRLHCKKFKPQKGCGQWFVKGKYTIQCGFKTRPLKKVHLCLECKPQSPKGDKNHSPQESPQSLITDGVKTIRERITEGTQNHSPENFDAGDTITLSESEGTHSPFVEKLMEENINKTGKTLIIPMKRFNELIKNHSPKVFIERAAKLDEKGIRAVCGTEEEYDKYVKEEHKPAEIKTLSDEIWNLIEYCDDCEKSGEEQKNLLSVKDVKNFIKKLNISPEELHIWYLEATKKLNPESFNKEAQKPYEELTEEQKFIDKFIADKINNKHSKLAGKNLI